jgi:Methyltransferase FkbM domain
VERRSAGNRPHPKLSPAVLGAPPGRVLAALRLVSGWRSLRRVRRLQAGRPHPSGPVELHFRALGDAPVRLRPGTSDLQIAHQVFVKERDLPPPELDPASIRNVWDLGASIGLTAAQLAYRYPSARVLAVELDPNAAALCRANVTTWADRCDVIEAAVAAGEGVVRHATGEAAAITLDSLLELSDGSGGVDYVRMDVAGAERDVLTRRTSWAHSVRAMKVEVHLPYTVDECTEDLRRLGFATSSADGSPRVVTGVR